MKRFGSIHKNFNVIFPKSQSPKARRPVLDLGASPHANWLVWPPRFPTYWHALPPPPPVLHAPIVATIQVDTDEWLLKQNKKWIS
jgi:hypothetical protein